MQELFQALKDGDAERLAVLLDADPAQVNARNEQSLPAVIVAQYYGRPELADLLRRRGADVDVFAAAALGDVARLEQILTAEPASLEAHSLDGWTPLHLASFFGYTEAARLLLDKGANVHALSANPMGNTPLHAASARSQRGVVELLLTRGADVNARQHGGWTALHAAASNGDTQLVLTLLVKGANAGARADNNQNAMDMALTHGRQEVVDLLEAHLGEGAR